MERHELQSDGGDDMTLQFRPRARLLQLLGDELIGSPRLAVFELVKNAYDADATRVTVTLKKIAAPDASITIQDNGDGMTLETIRDIWLVPGHDHRAQQRLTLTRTRLQRLPLGEKGLGRFAAHKLGNLIELITRSTGHQEYVVSINWTILIRNEFLDEASIRVVGRTPQVFPGTSSGTRITIRDLRQNWSRGAVRRLHRQITSISSPFTNESHRFKTSLSVPGYEYWLDGIPDMDTLLSRAPWMYRFRFDAGRFAWEYQFRGVTGLSLESRTATATHEPLLVPAREEPGPPTSRLDPRAPRSVPADASWNAGIGAVSGTFYVFDRDRDVLARLGEVQFIRRYLDDNGGVRVYRDGIRVYNYGEPDDDWLGLDLRRVNSPTRSISRNIILGSIELSLAHSAGLTEKTNREGFVENEPQRRLRLILLAALTPLEVERKKDKERIRRLTSSRRSREADRIRRPLKELRDASIKHHVSEVFTPIIDRMERDYNQLRDAMLRAGLSGMGLAIVFHEVEQGVRGLCDLIAANAGSEAVLRRAQDLSRVLVGFTDLLRKGESRPYSLNTLIRRVYDINRVRFRKHHVRLHCPPLEDGFAEVRSNFVFGLALGALNNLLDNAFYWLDVRWGKGARGTPGPTVHIGLTVELAEGPAIVVADNGPGFIDEPDDLIRPFFTRRPEGMGVGLYYAHLVMELGGGRLAFPNSLEAEVPEEFTGAVVALIFPKD